MLKKAYTLAEVLIVLGVIGVIAALTIPHLIDDSGERQTVSRVQTTYKAINDGYLLAIQKYGPMRNWKVNKSSVLEVDEYGTPTKTSSPSADKAAERILEHMKYDKINKTISYNYLTMRDGKSQRKTTYKYRLPSGVFMTGMWVDNGLCNKKVGIMKGYCGDFTIDINGEEEPNTYGVDMFNFQVWKDKILPQGIKGTASRQIETYCNMKSTVEDYNGYACAAWVVYKGNMDYLDKEIKW